MIKMTIKEMFEKVYTLPVDGVGVYEHQNGALHVYKTTGPQFNILQRKDGEARYNVINVGEKIKIIPVDRGVSLWERAVAFDVSDDVEDLPMPVYRMLSEAGIF
mgnify:CR=1 FL=1